ncbi:hypothetical protein BH24ACT9_BH24ACT9_02450 [soil metagenome]
MSWSSAPSAGALLLLSLALAVLPGTMAGAMCRLRRLSLPALRRGQGDPAVTGSAVGPRAGSAQRRALLFATLSVAAVLVTVPSVAGGIAAVAVAAGAYILLRVLDPSVAIARRGGWTALIPWPGRGAMRGAEADPSLPFAIDLLAVCLRAGMPTSTALRSVAAILSDGDRPERGSAVAPAEPSAPAVLARVAAASELGSEPAAAWQDWLAHPTYGPLARAMVVTGESGSAVAGRLEAVSQNQRSAAGQQAMARAQRTGVLLMAPLGLCFLPAFVCLGVVPVIVGIAGRVFG